MVPCNGGRVIDEATAVAGEQPSPIDRVQITPRINPVAARHGRSLAPVGNGRATRSVP